jgi:uncharacterized membrane protein YdfJ with MMPL/SSD domain
VTGGTAVNHDWSEVLRARTPVVLGAVAGLAFLVLLFSFRSVLLPLISIGLNLLSAGAAYGLITLIFQDGRLQGLLGFTSYGVRAVFAEDSAALAGLLIAAASLAAQQLTGSPFRTPSDPS